MRLHAKPGTCARAAAALLVASLTVGAAHAVERAAPGEQRIRVEAVWYADGSCRLSIDDIDAIGVTGIDADMGEDGARTMVHCDVESGQRITMMMLGNGLAIGERVVLEEPADIDQSVDGSVAWIADLQDGLALENTARRFIVDGRILIRETPTVDAADSTLNADKQPFAEIRGSLEPLRRHPDPLDAGATDEAPDPNGVTRMACRVRPCQRQR